MAFRPRSSLRCRRPSGTEVICNRPYNGIAAIEDFGAEHLRTGELILYTSQDSVLQLAAHVDAPARGRSSTESAPPPARSMSGEHAVGPGDRAAVHRPPGAFQRTEGRRDFAVPPPARSYLDELHDAGVSGPRRGQGRRPVRRRRRRAFAPRAPPTPGAWPPRPRCSASVERGLIFTNLIETDQVYGHRKDPEGFHRALQEIDARLADWLTRLRPDDLLVITADHGIDPDSPGTDHTREYAPLLAVVGDAGAVKAEEPGRGAASSEARRHDGPLADVGATALCWLTGRETDELPGQPFAR